MKIKHLVLISSVFLCTNLYAQNDFQINVSNLIFYEANVNYEFLALNDEISIGALGGYVFGFPGAGKHQFAYFGPELRYYVYPKNGHDRFFIGIYSRYKTGAINADISEYGEEIVTGNYISNHQQEDIDFKKVAIGLNIGVKWVNKNNFIFGFNIGLGRNLYYNYDEATPSESIQNSVTTNSYNYNSNINFPDSKYWDFRIGLNIGFRLGAKKPIESSEKP